MVDPNLKSWKSYLFVIVQIVSLGLITITGPLFSENRWLLFVEMMGLGLGIWSIIIMRPGNFNITPDPLSWSKLVKAGPYRTIRHPMYLALLLTTLPLIITSFSIFRLSIWIMLLLDLVLKINYEEKLLLEAVDGYEIYLNESHKIIPFVY